MTAPGSKVVGPRLSTGMEGLGDATFADARNENNLRIRHGATESECRSCRIENAAAADRGAPVT